MLDEIALPFVFDVRPHFSRVHDFLLEKCQQYGKTWGFTPSFNMPILLTADPRNVKHILQDNMDNYTKESVLLTVFIELLGEGIFQVSHGPNSPDGGVSWKLQRQIAAQIFTRTNFRGLMQDTFIQHGEKLVNKLKRECNPEQVVELQDLFFRLTLDSIGSLGFGVELGCIDSEETKPFVKAFDDSLVDGFWRLINPFSMIVMMMVPRSLRLPLRPVLARLPGESKVHRNVAILDEFSLEVIKQRREQAKPGPDGKVVFPKTDFLSLFMGAEQGPFDDHFLRDVVMSFFVAGRDTTASTLSFLFLLLGQHPEIQRELQAEVDQKLAGKSPTLDDLTDKNMPLLHAVVWEALRLFPPVAADVKCAAKDDVLPDGTFVPEGTEVAFLAYAMGRDPDLFPDPTEFKPSRWIPFKTPSYFDLPVFQAGPRICLGMNMALFAVKVQAALLVQSFEVKLAPGASAVYKLGPTIALKDGLPVYLRPRQP